MGIIINPWEQSGQEEYSGNAHNFQYRHLRVLERGPLMNHFDHGQGQKAKMRASRAYFSSVRDKDGRSEVADHPGAEINQANPLGARHLLEVPHQPELERHRDHQVEDPE